MRTRTLPLVLLLTASCQRPPPEYDVLIVHGIVIDGTGSPGTRADVAIANGAIAAVGPLENARAKVILEAEGRIVSPGFIDMMGGSSLPLIADPPSAESKLRQGITTMMAGEGGSLAPQNDRTFEGVPRKELDARWTTFDEYFTLLESKGIALNVVHNVGAEQVRRIVLGDEDVAPTPSQLEEMKGLVEQAMKDGAVGLSTSLIYPPGAYATTEEIVELARPAAAHGGVYFSHMRNESGALLEAIDEALRVGKDSGIPVHIYHLKAAGQENWPLMETALVRIREARASGMDVTADVYPYIRNGIGLGSFLHPRHYARGEQAFLDTLSDPKVRAELRKEVEETSDWENWYRHVGKDWANVLITEVGSATDPAVVGLSVKEAGEHMGKDVWDAFFDLVAARGTGVCPQSMDEAQKHLAMKEPYVTFDNDTEPTNPKSVASAHPRGFGAFPRILAKYVREENVIPLPEAIRKLTSLPASILRLSDRGRIEAGYAA
ncbi:MAG TPA: D-aminoacylase, partial [Vicinamibacteria bacterium]|nr:D-aminoacylase [Vicinamibacteria bacterium]